MEPGAEHVRPAPLEHDPIALADAEAAEKADRAEWETAAAALDVTEGRARRHGSTVPPAELRADQLAEEGARRRWDRSRRAVEERRVAAIMHAAGIELPAHADALHQAVDQLAAALDRIAETVGAQHRAHVQFRADLDAAAPGEVPTRLRLTGLEDRYAQLPKPAGPDPAELISRVVQAAVRRWAAR